jgi:hypothetical protein
MTIEKDMLCVSHNKNMRRFIQGKELRVSFSKWLDTLPLETHYDLALVSFSDFDNIDKLQEKSVNWRV